jgi:6-phosphogluconolactonase
MNPHRIHPRTNTQRLLRRFLAWASVLALTALTSCSDGTGGGVAQTPPSANSAVIGAAGGILNGPDGTQVVVPAGALDQPTTIGIARSSSGAPATLPDGSPANAIYEFTPHGLVFNKPVTIRVPVPANTPGTEVFIAGVGEGWQLYDSTVTNGYSQWQRNSFSWAMSFFCAPPANDLYPCVHPKGYTTLSAAPSTAITRVSPGIGNGGSWTVNGPGTVNMSLHYESAPDCAGNKVKLIRWNPAISPRVAVTLLDNVSVTLTPTPVTPPLGGFASTGAGPTIRGQGSTTFDISAYLTDALNAFYFSFSCQRPGHPIEIGGDLITVAGALPAPTGPFNIGGTVSGLTGSGLVLQNNNGANLIVPANASSFSFATPVANGAPYSVSVLTQPTGEICTVQNGSGTANAPVANVTVNCVSTSGPLVIVANSGVTNGNKGLSIYRANPATGALSFLSNANTGDFPWAVAVAPNGLYAYVTNLAGGSLSSFQIDNITGALTLIPLSSPGTQNPFGIAMDPQGRFLWVANYGSSKVSTFVIGAGGVLSASGAPVTTGTLPRVVAVHPSGNFVYVASESGHNISVYAVNSLDGTLTLVPGTLSNSVFAPFSITFDPSGQFIYVADASGSIAAFTVNPVTGVLSAPTYYTNVPSAPSAVAVHPNGKYLYVVGSQSQGIGIFQITPGTDTLNALGGGTATTGSSPQGLAIDSTGSYLYVTNGSSNTVSTFSIDGISGSLTEVGTPQATGGNPVGIAIRP